jgi:hypothetical protein
MTAPASAAGKTGKCTRCRGPIVVPIPTRADREDDEPNEDRPARARRYADEPDDDDEPRPRRRRGRGRRPTKKRSWWVVVLIVAAVAVPGFCLLGTCLLGGLVMHNEEALAGKWVVDPQQGAVPVEFQNVRIDLHEDGDHCVISKDGQEIPSRWGGEPNLKVREGWIEFPDTRRGVAEPLQIRGIDRDHIELFDPENPARKVRLKRAGPADGPIRR